MANLADLVVRVTSDVSGVKTGLATTRTEMEKTQAEAEKTGRRMSTIATSMQGIGTTMSIGVTLPVLAGFGLMTKAASDLEETVNKVTVVFGQNAAAVMKWSEDAASTMLMSQQQALESAGTYGNLLQAFGVTGAAAQEMSTTLVQLAADLASFNNTSVDEALLAIRSGLSGEMEPMKRFGVTLDEASLKAEALAMGLQWQGQTLPPLIKAQASYSLMLKQTTTAQGDVARTGDSLANSAKRTVAELKDVSAALGKELVPLAKDALGVIKPLVGFFGEMPGPVRKLTIGLLGLAAAAGPLAVLGANLLKIREGLMAWRAAKTAVDTAAIAANTAAVEANTVARIKNGSLAPVGSGVSGMGVGTSAASSGLLGGAAGSAAIAAVPVAIVASTILLTKDLNRQEGMDRRGIDPVTGDPVNVGTRRRGRGGTNDPDFKSLAESNLETRAALRDSIIASHSNTSEVGKAERAVKDATTASADLTAAVKDSTAATKNLAESTLQEARDAASKPVAPLSNAEFLKYVSTLPYGTAEHDRTGQVGMKYRKFASGGSGITDGPMLALIGEAGPEPYAIGSDYVGGRTVVFKDCTFSARSPRELTETIKRELARDVRYANG